MSELLVVRVVPAHDRVVGAGDCVCLVGLLDYAGGVPGRTTSTVRRRSLDERPTRIG